MDPTTPTQVFVVAHTHWDREWYLTAGRFRQRLVALVDELLGGGATPETPFLLDGQAVVLDDYLGVKPWEREAVGKLLRSGALEAGPWYVLPDELIPSGEALVRNLLAGRAVLRSFGAESPRVLYCPDSFGHPAALPLLAEGFGLPLIIVWRGYGGPAWPAGDVFRWRAAGGASLLTYHLARDGYELGSSLPDDPVAAVKRWESVHGALVARASVGVALLPNGADHHALQPRLDAAIAALERAAAPEASVRRSTLDAFARVLQSAAHAKEVPIVEDADAGGVELRNSYGYTWTLQGTFATRAQLKRRNALVERFLLRDVEPWVALAAFRDGGSDRRALLDAAWRSLLLCHPHDTLCGCSIDEVARAMAARLDDAASQGRGLRDDSILDVIGHDSTAARHSVDSWQPVVIVRNAVARPRGGIAEIEVVRFREHVRVGPGSAPERLDSSASAASDAGAASGAGATSDAGATFPRYWLDGGRVACQVLERSVRHDRVESPVAYPHADLVESDRIVAWIPPVAGYGTSAITIEDASHSRVDGSSARAPAASVRCGDHWLDNGMLRLELDSGGRVSLSSRDPASRCDSLLDFEDVGDVGDLYTHSPRPPVITDARWAGARLMHRGPLRGELHVSWVMPIPRTSDRGGRSTSSHETLLHAAFTLDADSPYLRVRIWGVNASHDHRLRVIFHTACSGADVWADAAFGPVRRSPIRAPDESAEVAPPTAPLARYVTVAGAARGLTLYSDGLAEYEATPEGDIAVTLLRAVGELSRNDLPERPGHAGWPAATPEAQSLGLFEGSFAILPHGMRTDSTIARIERIADDVLHPLCGVTLRSSVAPRAPTVGVELRLDQNDHRSLEGALAFSTCKPASDGEGIVLRCVNITRSALRARWYIGFPPAGAQRVRLDETPIEKLDVEGNTVPFEAAPRAVTTIVVHKSGSTRTQRD